MITLQDPIAFSIAMTSSQIEMGPQRFKGQVPRSRNFLNRTCFWKMFMHEVFFWENFGSWRGTWRMKRCGPIAICEEGHCDGKMGCDGVRWTLLRIGVLPQSQRIGITFWYVCLFVWEVLKAPLVQSLVKKHFCLTILVKWKSTTQQCCEIKPALRPSKLYIHRFLHVRDFVSCTSVISGTNMFVTHLRFLFLKWVKLTPSTQCYLFPIHVCFFLIPKEIPLRKSI